VTPSAGGSLPSTSFSLAPTYNGGGVSTGTTIAASVLTTPASTTPATAVQPRRVHRTQPFKMGDDIESFISRFEWSCMMDHVTDAEKAGNLLLSLDPKIFAIVDRELDANEKLNYDTLKRHLLKRFDIYKEAGLRRVLFTTLKREVGETHEDYYSRLLEVGNKAFTEENALTIDRMIRDQFMVKNDDKTRLYLIEKAPKTAKEALSLAISFQAAHSFNEAMKDSALTVATADVNGNNKPDTRVAGKGDTPVDRRDRSSSRDRNFRRNRNVSFEGDRQQSIGHSRDSSRERYYSDVRDRYDNDRDRGSGRRSPSFTNRYDNENRGNSRYWPDSQDRYDRGRNDRSREASRERYSSGAQGRFTGNRGQFDEKYPPNARRSSGEFNGDRSHLFDREVKMNSPQNRRGGRFNNQNRRRRDYSANSIDSHVTLPYVIGFFNQVEVPMLVDTGSAVTIINEDVWKLLKSNEPLDKVPFSVKSVTQHALEIVGQKDLQFQLKSKSKTTRPREFNCKIFVARGLAKEAILGLDFLQQYEAYVDTGNHKLVLFQNGTRSVHNLISRPNSGRTIAVVVKEDQTIEAKSQARIQCTLQEELDDGTLVYFEPHEEYLNTVPVAIAGVVDLTNQGEITTQIANPTCSSVDVKSGTVVGHVEPISSKQQDNTSYSKFNPKSPRSTDWLKKVDIGQEGFSHTEQRAITDLLLEFEDVFSHGEYDLGRTNIIEHAIEIVGEKPKRCGPRPLNPAMRQELEKQMNDLLKNDLIQPSSSEYACPVVLVKKKDGSIRFCCVRVA
jgi:hypothetical protein